MQSPMMRLTLRLHDGTERVQVADWNTTLETLAAAKAFPQLADFTITGVDLAVNWPSPAPADRRKFYIDESEVEELADAMVAEQAMLDAAEEEAAWGPAGRPS